MQQNFNQNMPGLGGIGGQNQVVGGQGGIDLMNQQMLMALYQN